MKNTTVSSISKVQIALQLLILFFGFGLSDYSYSQSLKAVSAVASDTTSGDVFTTVAGSPVTLDVTGINDVLVVSTFQLEMVSSVSSLRTARFRLADNNNPDIINSGKIKRSLSGPHSTDFGIGSLVYIFDVSSYSGNRTYVLQHRFTKNESQYLGTDGTIVAVSLKSGSEHLKNDVKIVSTSVTMGTSWSEVTGTETSVISPTVSGGFYVAACIESRCGTFDTEAVAEWKIQYKVSAGGTWTDLTSTVERSMSAKKDYGIINLVGSLPDNTAAGDYYFRVAHRRTSSTSVIKTKKAKIVAVSLGVADGVFPVFKATDTRISTTNSTLSNAVATSVTPNLNTDLFIHAQYALTADAETNSPKYDLFVDNSIFDGTDQKRYLSSSSDKGSGASVGLAQNLIASTTFNVSLRHASASSNILTSDDISLNGFETTLNSALLPVELVSFKARCADDRGVVLSWETASESNNNFFTLLRSEDGINWSEIGDLNGAGHSKKWRRYEYKDEDPTLRLTYYKLVQTDFDGTSIESEVTCIYCERKYKKVLVFPNPANNFVNINLPNDENLLDKPLIVTVYNSSGQVCHSEEFVHGGDSSFKLNLPENLSAGVYYLHFNICDTSICTNEIYIID